MSVTTIKGYKDGGKFFSDHRYGLPQLQVFLHLKSVHKKKKEKHPPLGKKYFVSLFIVKIYIKLGSKID